MMLTSPIHLQNELEQQVRVRTGRRVQNLTIELNPDRVVLRGRSSSYYVKQLAQQGIREILPLVSLENAIIVEGPYRTA